MIMKTDSEKTNKQDYCLLGIKQIDAQIKL